MDLAQYYCHFSTYPILYSFHRWIENVHEKVVNFFFHCIRTIMLIPFVRQPQQFMCKQTALKQCNDGKKKSFSNIEMLY
jgi:hypothetical protein